MARRVPGHRAPLGAPTQGCRVTAMSKYDELFDATAPTESVFADKGALDPLAEPDEIVARDGQEQTLATILNGVQEGYLPTTVSVHGPPGTGKTLTTRKLCREFAARHPTVAVEYVNLKECRTLFSAANEILFELTGETKKAHHGLDGVFTAIWEALADYPEWTVLLLDEIDHVKHDSNYEPSEFFYRLLRGEGKLQRDIQLSVWLISNELIDVDLRLDSRVQSAMNDEEVFFPPYDESELASVLLSRLRQAFKDGVFAEGALSYGISVAATRWGDARKALTLFRQAGETANERGLATVTHECLEANIEAATKAAQIDHLLSLPLQHFFVLLGITSRRDSTGEIIQPVTSTQAREGYEAHLSDESRIGPRAMRDIVTDLETMGLINTWMKTKGDAGRVKKIETTFDPAWVQEARDQYIDQSPNLDASTDGT